ncbi:DUF4097 family beta strand repeat-containing protein [Micromonospora sp. NPDC050686]|uniref:DUF4097 family beta strand repeat-containing protein n=1 Tax=Micromonospora sp. NPDC050686 TaxID=3154631 RepID=UPI00340E7DFB
MPAPRALPAAGAAALLIVLAGCDTLPSRRLDFDTTEPARIDRVTVRPGAGDVVLHGTGRAGEVRVKRTVRYQGDQPTDTWLVDGAELVLDTDCGRRCSVSYEVTVPKGVDVRGENGSGDVELSDTGPVQFQVGSGDVQVRGADGAVRVETGSGNIDVTDVTASVRLRTGSGNITGSRLAGAVDAEANSGNVTLDVTAPVPARAHAGSGDVEVVVPAGRYRVRSSTGSGDADLGIADDPSASVLLDLSTGSGNVTLTAR